MVPPATSEIRPGMRPDVIHFLPTSGRNPWLTDVVGELRAGSTILPIVLTVAPPGALHSDLRALGIEALSLGRATARDPLAILRLGRILRRRQPTIVHTHVFDPALAYAIAARVYRHRAIWVSTRHQQPGFIDLARIPSWKRSLFKALDGWLLRQMDIVIAISARSVREIRDLGVPADRVAEIPLGFDLRRLRPDPSSIDTARLELRGTGRSLVVCVARLSWEKNLSFLLRAWKRVVADIPTARLAIVGAGPLDAELRAEARALGLANDVEFLGYRRDALQLIGAADVVVQPSLTENMSMVGVEALAQGRPLVSTPVGIVGEHIVDRSHCLVAPPDDAEAFSSAVIALLRDPELADRIGRAGQRLVEQSFRVEDMARRYEALYTSLIGDRSARIA